MTALVLEVLQSPAARAVGIALLHFVWQASLVALVLAAVLGSIDRRSARLRYGISCAALALLVILPVRTAFTSFVPRPAETGTQVTPVAPVSLQGALMSGVRGAIVELNRASTTRERIDAAGRSLVATTPWLVAFWLLGVTIFSARFISGLAAAHRLAHRNVTPVPAECTRAVREIARRLGIRKAVRVLASARIPVPAVVGAFRPVVLVPLSAFTGLSTAQLETILAHELAHVRRHDFSINLAQSLVETLFFYHPAVWWISRQVRIEREHCCDDLAVSVCGNAAQYARALATLETLRSQSPYFAVAASGGSLLARIRRLAGIRGTRTAGDVAGLTAGVLAGLIALTLPVAFVAQQAFASSSPKSSGTEIEVIAPRVLAPEPAPAPEPPGTPQLPQDPSPAGYVYSYDLTAGEAASAFILDIDRFAPEAFDRTSPLSIDVDIARHVTRIAAATASGRTSPVAIAPPTPLTPSIAPAPRPPAPGRVAAVMAPPAPRVRPGTPAAAPRVRGDRSDSRPLTWNDLDVEELVALKHSGVTREFVAEIAAAGLTDLDLGEAIALGSLGVTAEYVRDVRAAFGASLDTEDVIPLKALGVTSDYVASIRSVLPRADAEAIVSLKAMGLTAAEVRDLRAAYPRLDDPEDFVAWKAVGVSPEWLEEIAGAGFRDLDVDEAVGMRSVGVDAAWIEAMRAAGVRTTDPDELVSMKAVGVTPEYVRELREAGLTDLDADRLVQLRAAGIDLEWIRSMKD